MTHQEFIAEMGRLSQVFGERSYPTERTKLIWNVSQSLPVETFRRVVEGFIGSSRQPPLMPEFRDAIQAERQHEREHRPALPDARPWERPNSCEYCYDTGVVLCEKHGERGVYAFRCPCLRGQGDPRTAIPFYAQAHRRDFAFYDVRLRGAQVLRMPDGGMA